MCDWEKERDELGRKDKPHDTGPKKEVALFLGQWESNKELKQNIYDLRD